MFNIRIDSIARIEGAVLHRDVALEQAHVDLLIDEGTVDDVGVIDHSPHSPPGVVDNLTSIQDDMLRSVLWVLRIGIFVVVMLTGEP